jgi:hypothetical protein
MQEADGRDRRLTPAFMKADLLVSVLTRRLCCGSFGRYLYPRSQ